MVVLPAVFPAIRKVCPDTGEELALTYSIPSANRPRVHRDSTVKNTPSQVVVGKLDSFKPPASHPCLQTTFIFFFFFFRYQKRANDSKWDEVRWMMESWWPTGGAGTRHPPTFSTNFSVRFAIQSFPGSAILFCSVLGLAFLLSRVLFFQSASSIRFIPTSLVIYSRGYVSIWTFC